MEVEIQSWLYDISKAITEIESFFTEDSKNIRCLPKRPEDTTCC